VCSNFSRLVIDPNRGEKDPTLVMQLYDGTIIPANKNIAKQEILRRLNLFYRPYHNAIDQILAPIENPIIVSIHSFTPQLKGKKNRPWHIGLLAANDRRFHNALLGCFASEPRLCVGDNQPYIGKLPGDTIDKHAIEKGRLNTLVEVRNDLIANNENQKTWAKIIGKNLNQAKDLLDG
jgi:predicted N-formylglutamate amidohydrolase